MKMILLVKFLVDPLVDYKQHKRIKEKAHFNNNKHINKLNPI
jgi:hypothetical protein